MARPRPLPAAPPPIQIAQEFDRPQRFDEATGPRDFALALGPKNEGAGGGTRVMSPDPFLSQSTR
jgi:hypothetical protein